MHMTTRTARVAHHLLNRRCIACTAGEYLGGAVTCDAHHMTDPRADGLGVSTCINLALKDARIEKEQARLCLASLD